jgi:CRP-like cAMP-binding protein
MSDLTTYAVFQHNSLFCGLPGTTIDAVASVSHRAIYQKNALIFSQGDDGDALYGIASGQVRIFAADDKGHEIFYNLLGPGDTFGEVAVLDGQPRTASAMTTTPAVLAVIPRRQFLNCLTNDPELAMHMIRLLCGRLRWMSMLIEETALLAGPARVAKRLLSLVGAYGRPAPAGGIELTMSQADLGRFLGISRQVINHYLRDWSDRGWVELHRGRIIICSIEALHDVVVSTS